MKYKSVCVTGFNFGFSDGTMKSVGIEGTDEIKIELTSRKLYSFQSWCGYICDFFRICSVDETTSNSIECFNSGNMGESFLKGSASNLIHLNLMEVKSFFGTMNYGWHCISTLGITYSPIPTSTLSLLLENTLNLVRHSSIDNTTTSNFTQSTQTSKGFKMTRLNINYNSHCVTGFSFDYSDGSRAHAGFNGTNAVALDLSGTKSLYSVLSYCDHVCDFMRFCSVREASKIECVDAGKFHQINYAASTKDFVIQSFYGHTRPWNTQCIQNIGIKYKL